ncbi:FGGY carbohydrate kinase domain-containing protein isoform X1 [Neodiprion lecontei]|uniref:FGGY carbohydrate kinase domain-containing protein n=2 Tax=Neodiprion lecontei TaxID=441921 RepID=A0A6J0BJP5_NEOLC|nr:FGGY carbohydrate kinase domain-containing protein isoform X1 [Neodiprion lecontei]
MESIYFVGVDVGTGSARAAIVSSNGKLINMATCPIKTFNPRPNFFEQSSDDIWSAVCNVVKTVTKDVSEEKIKGIGFDATCSLVALDEHGRPVTVSPTGNDEQNVILWMDHRAEAESAFINSTKDEMLRYVGGKISLEMETPKMLWMKKNMPTSWLRAKMLFDLPDFLTWRATRSQSRSLCSLVCKWNYKAGPDGNNGWNAEFFNKIGLSDLSEDNWRKIGTHVKPPGDPVALGLTAEAANELGLSPKTPVGTSIIDAHAGGLGMIGCSVPGVPNNFSSRLSLICGTSTCHMAISDKEITVDGVWGPYYSVMIPRFWLSEGGQSATGKLLDHIINSHPATASIMHQLTGLPHRHIQQYLSDLLISLAKKNSHQDVAFLTRNIHVWPDFHGNRSPLADVKLRGMISGLSLSSDQEDLAVLYLATIQALAYGTRHIIEALTLSGHNIETVLICGGLSQNPLFVHTQADVVGLPVLIPHERESVLLGAAILGACAAGVFPSVQDAIREMGGTANLIAPNALSKRYHQQKYEVFKKMVQDQKTYASAMDHVLV